MTEGDQELLENCRDEWNELQADFASLEETHKKYQKLLAEVQLVQSKCLKGIHHQLYRIGQTMNNLKNEKNCVEKVEFEEKFNERIGAIASMQETLPRTNGMYLKIILGNVNVSLLNKQEKYKYKDEYERFKLIVTSIILVLSFINVFIKYRFMNSSLLFLLVWYYCTLTIRESILKVNGSRIKGWWRLHHFIATALSGILLIWPDGVTFDQFNRQFMMYSCYTSFVQFLQFNYQQGALYRLKCLGERHKMDITIEGFYSWMFRGLSFLLPFLYVAYLIQLYNAYTLWKLSSSPDCVEWQVPVLAAIFLLLFVGNSATTSMVVHQKFKEMFYPPSNLGDSGKKMDKSK